MTPHATPFAVTRSVATDFYAKAFWSGFEPPPRLAVWEWANAHRVLPKETSAEAGPYRTERTPFARQIMDDLSEESEHEDIVLMCATQLIKSETGLNWLGYIIQHTPAPVMIVQATVDTAKRYSRQRIGPMVSACPTLRARVSEARARNSSNTLQMKEFPGGVVVITGANSAAGLASMPARFIHFDERDDYPDDVDGQGEPTRIARARQDTFLRRRRLTSSSPKRPRGESRIEADFMAGTRFYFHVPCPHCEASQRLEWSNVERMESGDAMYRCAECASLIEEHHKPEMFAAGEWVAEAPDARVRSYHLNSLYSPLGWLSWSSLCDEFLQAEAALNRGDENLMKVFHNTRLALTVEEKTDKLESAQLREREEPYALRTVPMQALVLTAGIDVQDDRFEVVVTAWSEGDESWVVDYVRLHGDPADVGAWRKLAAYLDTKFEHACGAALPISAEAIDTGGHFTHQVYNFARSRPRTFAVKGSERPGLPIKSKSSLVDVNAYNGAVIKHGVRLWFVGTDTAKDLLHNRLRMRASGPGYMHLSRDLDDEFFAGMVSEHRIKRKTAHGFRSTWVKKTANARNEPLDCSVYSLFAAQALDLPRYTSRMWQLRRTRLETRAQLEREARDTAAPAPAVTEPQAQQTRPAPRVKRRGGFVMGWK